MDADKEPEKEDIVSQDTSDDTLVEKTQWPWIDNVANYWEKRIKFSVPLIRKFFKVPPNHCSWKLMNLLFRQE